MTAKADADEVARLRAEVAELRAQLDEVRALELIQGAIAGARELARQTEVQRAKANDRTAVEERERAADRESLAKDPPITIEPAPGKRLRIGDVLLDAKGLWGTLLHVARSSWWTRVQRDPAVAKLVADAAVTVRPSTDRESRELLRDEHTARRDREARTRAEKARARP